MRVLLFTGGLDSTALAWTERPDRLLFVDYGQRPAKGEERAARAVARSMDLLLDVRRADLSSFGHGTMSTTGSSLPGTEHAPEFWPYRNQMLVTLAAMTYAADPVQEILIGTVVGDDAHPDGRQSFVAALDALVNLQSGPRVRAPAIGSTTEELLLQAKVPDPILGWTFSCHTGEWACGSCRGCSKHRQILERIHPAPRETR